MKKVLIQQGILMSYRIELFNELSQHYDLTVLHSGNYNGRDEIKFKQIVMPEKKIYSFLFQHKLLRRNIRDFDAIILLFNFNYIANFILLLLFKKNKIILWGPWQTGKKVQDFFRRKLIDGGWKVILYSKKHLLEYKKITSNNLLFVANNTINVSNRVKSYQNEVKNSILFVGTFNERKKLLLLVEAFSKLSNEIDPNIELVLVGSGNCEKEVSRYVLEKNLTEKVKFAGRISDDDLLKDYYKQAIISVSLGQAGLSILQSFGFGVPFMTLVNSISGGEKYNIINGKNGILCEENICSIVTELKKVCNDIDYARRLGENAYQYYDTYCTIQNMAQGFKDAIEGTRESKIDMDSYKI